MQTYSEEAVRSIIAENLRLVDENERLKVQLSEETSKRESAEKNYFNLCERCISFYITQRDMEVDTIFVQATAPRFMTKEDFNNGVAMNLINLCVAEREKHIFHATHISNCKEREDV